MVIEVIKGGCSRDKMTIAYAIRLNIKTAETIVVFDSSVCRLSASWPRVLPCMCYPPPTVGIYTWQSIVE